MHTSEELAELDRKIERRQHAADFARAHPEYRAPVDTVAFVLESVFGKSAGAMNAVNRRNAQRRDAAVHDCLLLADRRARSRRFEDAPTRPDVLCYGIDCHCHLTCQRYVAADGARDQKHWIAACGVTAHRPMFVAVETREPV